MTTGPFPTLSHRDNHELEFSLLEMVVSYSPKQTPARLQPEGQAASLQPTHDPAVGHGLEPDVLIDISVRNGMTDCRSAN